MSAAAGAGGWRIGRSGTDRIPTLERRVRALETSSKAVGAERDRLRAERDRLETQLAALDRTPAACAEETLSTADAHLLVPYIVDYPCGWNVLEEPFEIAPEGSGREGLQVDHLFLSALPISTAPRGGPLTEISLDSWYDDPNASGDALPTIDAWIVEGRKRFDDFKESVIHTRSGIAVRKLTGEMTTFDEARKAVLYLWEFTDRNAVRRICEAFALDPGLTVSTTIESLVLSFRLPGA